MALNKTRLDEMFYYLSGQGLRPEKRDYGLYFRYNMLNFTIYWDEDDAEFLKINLPGIYQVNYDNLADVLLACNAVNLKRKVVKAYIVDGESVHVAAEQLLDTSPDYDDVIPRTLNMLVQARDIFYQEIENNA